MINFKQVSFERAMTILSEKRAEDLYIMLGGSLSCVENLRLVISDLDKEGWFEKETDNE